MSLRNEAPGTYYLTKNGPCSAKEVKKAPVILEKLQNSGVPEGHLVRLECRVIGMPPPVFYWKKDNETIPCTRERIRYGPHMQRDSQIRL